MWRNVWLARGRAGRAALKCILEHVRYRSGPVASLLLSPEYLFRSSCGGSYCYASINRCIVLCECTNRCLRGRTIPRYCGNCVVVVKQERGTEEIICNRVNVGVLSSASTTKKEGESLNSCAADVYTANVRPQLALSRAESEQNFQANLASNL